MFEFISIENYHTQLRDGKIRCVQVVQHYLQAISSFKHLNAYIEVYEAEALQKAHILDREREKSGVKGALHGVVIALKDIISYKGHALSASSRILQDFIPVYSATVVEKLLSEEAIIIGRLNCDEFAMGSSNENSYYGNVLNAVDTTRIPGGSSGGSAVAVQAGLAMVTLGSDTGGSVRQPADFCGVIGLKPSYGRISRYGLIAYASSFDQIGIFGKTVSDVAIVLQVIAGSDDYDSTVSHRDVGRLIPEKAKNNHYRFSYFPEMLDHPSIDQEISTAIRKFLDWLSQEGHTVKAVEFEYLDFIVPAYYVLTTAEASSNLSRFDGVKYGYRSAQLSTDLQDFYTATRSEGFGKEVKRRIMLGTFVLSSGYYDAYFTKAQQVRQLLRQKTSHVFEEADFIILPTSPSTAFRIGEKTDDPIAMYLADIYTVMANLVGIPSISLPFFKHSNQLPFGLQIMANNFQELPLLQASSQLMDAYSKN